MALATSVVGAKAQVTLPKSVREALKIRGKGECIGFILEEGRVILTKAAVVPAAEEFTDQVWRNLLELSRQKGGRTYRSGKTFLKALRRMAGI